MTFKKEYDLVCVGGGIMSAHLALICKFLNPGMDILIVERLSDVALESSAAMNNAGTGHSALCELNYCPENEDGTVSIEKAIKICQQFEISKQFWAFLKEQGLMDNPSEFLQPVPHMSWVKGERNVDYLKRRYEAMKKHYMFDDIEISEDHDVMSTWFPLIMKDRNEDETLAASRIDRGTEVNFGALTRRLFSILEETYDTKVYTEMEVTDVDPSADIDWTVEIKDLKTNETHHIEAEHVFIGAGGGSLLLLQKVEIDEKDGYGGFPVGGQWLICKNEELVNSHFAKVYSKAGIGEPPMSTPHLDTRYIDGKKALLFGPFAGFSPKFLKEGSNMDLLKSVTFDNIPSMFGAFWHNLPLTKYLIEQVLMSHSDRMDALRVFMKDAKDEEWELYNAGQRVQIIKQDDYDGGKLQFGTEVISSKDGSITCLLGASPGASTSPSIMLEVIKKAFPELLDSQTKLLERMVPSWIFGENPELFARELARTTEVLQLNKK